MRVLVTGGLGFIGSAVARAFVEHGNDVFIVDDRSGNVVDDVPGAVVHTWDLMGVDLSRHLPAKFDVVVHAAAPVGAVGVLGAAGRIVTDIVGMTGRVATFAHLTGARLINISSSEVYGRTGRYDEADVLEVRPGYTARREYAVGKLAAEYVVMGRPELQAVTVRPFNVVGPGQPSAKGFVLPTFCEQAVAGHPLTVFGDGGQRRALTGVWDVVRFIEHAAVMPDLFDWDGRPYNVGNPANETTILDLARLVLDIHGRGAVEFTDGKSIHGAAYEEADGRDKLPFVFRAGGTGWSPVWGLRDIVERTYQETRDAVAV